MTEEVLVEVHRVVETPEYVAVFEVSVETLDKAKLEAPDEMLLLAAALHLLSMVDPELVKGVADELSNQGRSGESVDASDALPS